MVGEVCSVRVEGLARLVALDTSGLVFCCSRFEDHDEKTFQIRGRS